jgi:hypothetical protein
MEVVWEKHVVDPPLPPSPPRLPSPPRPPAVRPPSLSCPPAINPVGDSHEGPLKTEGASCLKPAKNAKRKTHLEPNTKRTHTAQPTPRWPPRPTRAAQQGAPSSKVCLARGLTTPWSEVRLARGLTHPRAGSASLEGPRLLERTPPRSRIPHEHTCSRTRVRAFNALTRQSCATTRLGITPRRCTANSLGGAHPRYCGGLCDKAGVSSVTLCRPLLYG